MAQQQQPGPWMARNRQYVLLGLAGGGAAVAAYQLWRSERLRQAADTLAKYHGAASAAGDVLASVSNDLRAFLASDADELPRSLRQLCKLARSPDVQDTLAACVASAAHGAVGAAAGGGGDGPPLVDKLIEAVLSDRGQTLVGLAVRTAAQTSSEAFAAALRQGVQAAAAAYGAAAAGPASTAEQQRQQEQHLHTASSSSGSPAASPQRSGFGSPAAGGAFGSPAGGHLQARQLAQQQRQQLPPALGSVVAVLGSPQVLALVDALVGTTVGSAVGAYVRRAGSDNVVVTVLDALAQPGAKDLVIDIMSAVSAAFCREAAAACVAPAAAVASRPPSRLEALEPAAAHHRHHHHHAAHRQQLQQQQHAGASPPLKPLLPGRAAHGSAGSLGAAEGAGGEEGDGSEPSTPQSGPSTPEPSIAAADVAGRGAGPLAGSAVAGLILRRHSFPGLGGGSGGGGGWGSWGGGALSGDAGPAALGPMSALVSLFVQAARFQEFRSLMVDVSRSSTREFVHSLLPSGWAAGGRGAGGRSGGAGGGAAALSSSALAAAVYRVYTSVSVLLFLMVYALGPRTLLEGTAMQ